MLTFIGDFLRHARGYRTIDIVEDTDVRLKLRQGGNEVVFDRRFRLVFQRARRIDTFSNVQRVVLRKSFAREDLVTWRVSIRLAQGRTVRVGDALDELDASIIGARIAGVVGCAVDLTGAARTWLGAS